MKTNPFFEKTYAQPMHVTAEHANTVPDYQDVEYFEKKSKRVGIKLDYANSDIHLFRVVCSDCRMKSQRVINAHAVLKKKITGQNCTLTEHTIESPGATLYPEELIFLRKKIARILNKQNPERNPVFLFESITHAKVTGRENTLWEIDDDSNYNCQLTDGALMSKEMAQDLLSDGIISSPREKCLFHVNSPESITRFMESEYGKKTEIAENAAGPYFLGNGDTYEHMQNEHNRISAYFEDEFERKNVLRKDIRTYICDLADMSLWQVGGKPGGWDYWEYRLIELEKDEKPFKNRIAPHAPKVLAICHMDCPDKANTALEETLNLGPMHAPEKCLVASSGALENGVVSPAIHQAMYYLGKHGRGKKIHIRGRTSDETSYFCKIITSDALCNWMIKKFGLDIVIASNANK